MRLKLFSYTSGALGIGALMLCGACSTTESSTRVTDVWKDQSYAAGPMKNIVVFGARLEETQRRTLEDGFVSTLSQHDTTATQSYKVVPTPLPPAPTVRSMVQQAGYDGILVATLRSESEAVTTIGGVDFYTGYYGPAWGEPYYATTPVVTFETTLWDAKTGKMVWSALSRTDNPRSGKDFTKSLTEKVVPMLVKNHLVAPRPGESVSFVRPAPGDRLTTMHPGP